MRRAMMSKQAAEIRLVGVVGHDVMEPNETGAEGGNVSHLDGYGK